MHPVARSLALCTLLAAPLAAQDARINVQTTRGPLSLRVQVIPGLGDKVAMAAEKGAASDGVMVVPMPGSEFSLRTQVSREGCDTTSMVPASQPNQPSAFAESNCTSTWNAGGQGDHRLETALGDGELPSAWAQRHADGMAVIAMVYPFTPGAQPQPVQGPRSRNDIAATAWNDAQGVRHEVTTRRRQGEEQADWMARHQRAVEVFAGVLPPRG